MNDVVRLMVQHNSMSDMSKVGQILALKWVAQAIRKYFCSLQGSSDE